MLCLSLIMLCLSNSYCRIFWLYSVCSFMSSSTCFLSNLHQFSFLVLRCARSVSSTFREVYFCWYCWYFQSSDFNFSIYWSFLSSVVWICEILCLYFCIFRSSALSVYIQLSNCRSWLNLRIRLFSNYIQPTPTLTSKIPTPTSSLFLPFYGSLRVLYLQFLFLNTPSAIQICIYVMDKLQIYRMSYMDDFIHRLNMIPPQADSLLRQIRKLDKEVQELRLQLEPRREAFLRRLDRWTDKKNGRGKSEIDEEYRHIVRIENQMEAKSKQKVAIAEGLYNLIHEPTQKLQKELKLRGIDKQVDQEGGFKKKRGKKPARKGLKRSQWEYDPNEPKYCYCGRPSFGEMVMCENTYCQRQWFHVDCLDEKKLPEKWFCKHCRGQSGPQPKKSRGK